MTGLTAFLTGGGFLTLIGIIVQQVFSHRKQRIDTAASLVTLSEKGREADRAEYERGIAERDRLARVVLANVPPIIAWIDDGAPPPSPVVVAELRGALYQMAFLYSTDHPGGGGNDA